MRLFFIGICGTAMGNVAAVMRQAGHDVAGSDQGVYPPMSDILSNSGVALFSGFDVEAMISFNPDLVVVGNAVTRGNPQVEYLLEQKRFQYTSLPALIGEHLLGGRKRVVVSGTHGKTTTTSICAWLMQQAEADPGWLIGGVPHSLQSGAFLGGEQAPFVIEGDEYDSAFFDKRSKFIHYRPDVLIINNIEFDHADIFRDLSDVKRTFDHLIRTVPANGLILANGDDPAVRELLPVKWTRTLWVGVEEGNDIRITDFEEDVAGSRFNIIYDGKTVPVSWGLKGLYNARNAPMALLASSECVYGHTHLAAGRWVLDGFRGVKRRQDVLFKGKGLTVIEDFGHHPTAIANCIASMRNCYPDAKLHAVFEPRSNTSATNVLEKDFEASLSQADAIWLAPVHRAEIYDPSRRMDTAAMAERLVGLGREAFACGTKEELFDALLGKNKESEKEEIVLLFTNGSFGAPLQDYLGELRGLQA